MRSANSSEGSNSPAGVSFLGGPVVAVTQGGGLGAVVGVSVGEESGRMIAAEVL